MKNAMSTARNIKTKHKLYLANSCVSATPPRSICNTHNRERENKSKYKNLSDLKN